MSGSNPKYNFNKFEETFALELYPPIEFDTPEAVKKFQEERLRLQLAYLLEKSKYYRELFTQHDLDISQIETLDDLVKIPTTSKDDLQNRNDDFFCVLPEKIVDYCTTSGTLGDPVTIALSDADLDRLAYNEAISFACAGVKPGDKVQLLTTIDKRFMAGLAYFLGVRKLGASIIRIGPGVPELQWDSIQRFKPKFLVAVPSFLLKMIDYAEKNQIDYNASSVRGVICIGESLRNDDLTDSDLAKKITEKWNIKLLSTYASTEMATAFSECEHQCGGHHHPELIIAEILDENGLPAKKGSLGELVITTLGVEAMPLLRFRTGDLVRAHYEKCSCGRTTMRLGPVVGRRQQMIKYKGTTLYPPALTDILSTFDGVTLYQIILQTSSVGTDEILVKYHSEDRSMKFMVRIRDHFRAKLRVKPALEWCDKDTLYKDVFDETRRKPLNFIDKR